MTDYGYSSVPGSNELKTAKRGADDQVAALEALDASATAGKWVHGEWLCRSVVRDGAVAVLEEVFDRILPQLEAEEAAVYLQLYRLSFGRERNWCRTSRKALRARSNLSDRRLGGALAGLVERDHVRLLHRDRRGTLYLVRLPHEILGEPDHDRVFSARPTRGPTPSQREGKGEEPEEQRAEERAERPVEQPAEKPAEQPAALSERPKRAERGPDSALDGTPGTAAPHTTKDTTSTAPVNRSLTVSHPKILQPDATVAEGAAAESGLSAHPDPAADRPQNTMSGGEGAQHQGPTHQRGPASPLPKAEPRAARTPARLTVGGVAAGFVERFAKRGASNAEVVEAIFLRMEENVPLSTIAEELERFGKRAPEHTPLADLGRWLAAE